MLTALVATAAPSATLLLKIVHPVLQMIQGAPKRAIPLGTDKQQSRRILAVACVRLTPQKYKYNTKVRTSDSDVGSEVSGVMERGALSGKSEPHKSKIVGGWTALRIPEYLAVVCVYQ